MQVLGGLLLVGVTLMLIIWAIVWFLMTFWPWLLGMGITWLVLWFIWPDFRFWWTMDGIRAAHQRAMWRADEICEDTIEDMNQEAKGSSP